MGNSDSARSKDNLTKERFEQIKKDGKLMSGNIGPRMFKELVDEIVRLRPDFQEPLSTKDLIERVQEAQARAHEKPRLVGSSGEELVKYYREQGLIRELSKEEENELVVRFNEGMGKFIPGLKKE